MKILSLELQHYKRLSLNNINYIKLTPQSKIQLILGLNGSGKSSLMKELSPLPAIPAEYHKDGFKIIEILHNNSLYILKSIFPTTGNKFHFIKDNEELNPGGTATVYKELVKKEFNISQDVHDLMTGTTKFHSMSVGERRNWFTRISDSDYTYAITFYQKLKEQLRDMQGAIKLNQSRLVQESEKLLKPIEYEKIKDEIHDLNKLLSIMLEMKAPSYISKDTLVQQFNEYEKRLEQLSRYIMRLRSTFLNKENFSSITDIENAIIETQVAIKFITGDLTLKASTIENKQKTLDSLKNANVTTSKDIDNTIVSINEEIDGLYKHIQLTNRYEDPTLAYQALSSISSNLVDIASNLEVNDVVSNIRKYSRESYAKLMEEQTTVSNQISVYENQQNQYLAKKKELEHFKEHGEIECPQCKHVWFKGYDETVYQNILHNNVKVASLISSLKVQLARNSEDIQKIKDYMDMYRSYISLTSSYSILNPLWSQLLNDQIVFDSPNRIKAFVNTTLADLRTYMKIDDLSKRLKETLSLKDLIAKDTEIDSANLSVIIEQLNLDLYKLNRELMSKKHTLSNLQLYKQSSVNIEGYIKEIEEIMTHRENKTQELLNISRRDALNETIRIVQIELTKKEQIVSRINNQQAVVKGLEDQLKEYTNKVNVLKIATKELSPTEGLIAKGLTGFINHFVYQINSFIKKIWLYPLELIPIVPTEEDEVDLDYKFSVKINDNNIIPDIKLASSAMKEVIDLAFRIVSMQYLNLQDAPLYLDELGASFDKEHREGIAKLITTLSISENYSQIFIISHYQEMYGSFVNTDVTVLCNGNLGLSTNSAFNTNCVIR
jgi:energy-coupling factor transporter ATP-binding protein EcfA2